MKSPSLAFHRDLKADRGVGELHSGERKGSKQALIGGSWPGETGVAN